MKRFIITSALVATAMNFAVAQEKKNVEVTIDGVAGFQDTRCNRTENGMCTTRRGRSRRL